jgi:NADP-reducing hydrogenase subunit HndB
MPKLSVGDLETIRESASKGMSLRLLTPRVRIWVHVGDTGIEFGAREVLNVLLSELEQSGRRDIQILTSDRIENSTGEPNLTIGIEGNPSVVYHKVNPDIARRIFQSHVLKGEVKREHVMPTLGSDE